MSAATMANRMLEEDFKSSHPDLSRYAEETEAAVTTTTLEANPDNKKQEDDDPQGKNEPAVAMPPPKTAAAGSPKRKSVDFAIKPPAKRSRGEGVSRRLTPKQVVDAVGTSISSQERLDAIRKAKDAFDHGIQAEHDEEIAAGSDAVLAKHLAFLVWQSHQQQLQPRAEDSAESIQAELCRTCEVMDLLYQASSSAVGASFHRMGSTILQLLVNILDDEISRRLRVIVQSSSRPVEVPPEGQEEPTTPPPTEEDQQQQEVETDAAPQEEVLDSSETRMAEIERASTTATHGSSEPPPDPVTVETAMKMLAAQGRSITPPLTDDDLALVKTVEGDLLLRKVTRILGHFARVGDATEPMAHFPGLLGALLSLITFQPYDCMPWESRLSALWTIANLGCNPENMQLLVCTPGLVAALVLVACRPLHHKDSLETTMEVLRSRSIASRALLNMSWAPENKILLSERVALLDLLAELSVHRDAPLKRSRTVEEILLTTRRHAVGALRNLAAAPRRTKIALCDYRNGRLLDVLTDAALNDVDANVKDRAFAAIHNLAVHDTAEKIVNHPALVLALKDVLLSEDEAGGHQDGTPRSHASATLMVLERSITPEMDSYENLKDLLQAVNPNPTSDEAESDDMEAINPTAV